MVILQQPSQPFPTLDLAGNLADLVARLNELIVESLVISFAVVVLEESGDCPTQ
jgi:hypothetical protein